MEKSITSPANEIVTSEKQEHTTQTHHNHSRLLVRKTCSGGAHGTFRSFRQIVYLWFADKNAQTRSQR